MNILKPLNLRTLCLCVCLRCWLLIWRNKLQSCKRRSFPSLHQSSTFLTLAPGDARSEADSAVFCRSRTKMTPFVFVILRLYNYEPLTPLRMLRASVFGRLVCVKGTVVRVSNIRPFCTRLAFRCLGCSHTQSLPLQHGKYATPTKVRPHNHRAVIRNSLTCNIPQS